MKPQKSDFAPVHFSTGDLPGRDRLALYRDQFGRNLFHLDIEPLPDRPFRAELTMHAFPGVFIASNVGGGLREWRTSEMTADSRDEFAFVINLRGPSIVAQRGREFVMEEQSATIGVLDEIGGIMRPTLGHHLHVLHMPRATLGQLVRHAEMRPIPRYSASLRLLRAYVAMLQRSDITHEPSMYALIGSHVHDLVAATNRCDLRRHGGCTRPRQSRRAARDDPRRRARQSRGRTARGRDDQPPAWRQRQLCPHAVRRDRAELWPFGRFVEEERLKRAFALLTHPTRAVRKIGEIASTVGSPEPSMFSRDFRRRFGDTPSGVRRSRVDQSGLA